jgi:hypothetical protein
MIGYRPLGTACPTNKPSQGNYWSDRRNIYHFEGANSIAVNTVTGKVTRFTEANTATIDPKPVSEDSIAFPHPFFYGKAKG